MEICIFNFFFLCAWPWPDELHVWTLPVFAGDTPDVQIWTFCIEAFESYCLTDKHTYRHTELTKHTTSWMHKNEFFIFPTLGLHCHSCSDVPRMRTRTFQLGLWRGSNSNSTTFELRTFSPDLKFDECFKCFVVECEFVEKYLTFYDWFHMHRQPESADKPVTLY